MSQICKKVYSLRKYKTGTQTYYIIPQNSCEKGGGGLYRNSRSQETCEIDVRSIQCVNPESLPLVGIQEAYSTKSCFTLLGSASSIKRAYTLTDKLRLYAGLIKKQM